MLGQSQAQMRPQTDTRVGHTSSNTRAEDESSKTCIFFPNCLTVDADARDAGRIPRTNTRAEDKTS